MGGAGLSAVEVVGEEEGGTVMLVEMSMVYMHRVVDTESCISIHATKNV